ncbi:MAG: DUF2225 domain-containing protein [Defluviitaleaceae bacterium]|nr:DUF2225 domain-containing protein [Defluviitaleaceae bacterium]
MSSVAEQPTNQPTEEEILEYLFPKSFRCPVCDKEFMDFIIKKSKLKSVDTDTDFMTTYKDIDPNQYDVLFCTLCGYAALSSYFEKITARQQAMIREKISPNYKPMEFPMPLSKEHIIHRFKQSILCAAAIEAKASQKAFISLKLAWVLRKMGQKELEKRFLKDALEGLKTAFTAERFPLGNMDEASAKYIIADLARRTGDLGEAMRWIGDLVVSRGLPGSLKERASNLKEMIKEGITT